jgi:hypothetical protein
VKRRGARRGRKETAVDHNHTLRPLHRPKANHHIHLHIPTLRDILTRVLVPRKAIISRCIHQEMVVLHKGILLREAMKEPLPMECHHLTCRGILCILINLPCTLIILDTLLRTCRMAIHRRTHPWLGIHLRPMGIHHVVMNKGPTWAPMALRTPQRLLLVLTLRPEPEKMRRIESLKPNDPRKHREVMTPLRIPRAMNPLFQARSLRGLRHISNLEILRRGMCWIGVPGRMRNRELVPKN